ncbi:MAG TPA: aminoacyl-histidine dipeptidase [Candidatus Krumholzibacteria bacterium]|nr:aminoacyl-histidine dipeptidase [Candidatus Krumholzibacteria bacterium]HPD71891.1 aminoacyl-histidine dipeptidase [Candidatus Krumholzibacteria bacterium]HRY41176.1 aminoacyl-histidine dipeptidase [Candidatus Krumholzibacteria bacterium]
MATFDELQPRSVWQIFGELARVPRGSGNEKAVMAMLKTWATGRGLVWREDGVGNLLVEIPASPGLEHASPVLVQGHVDMVCEKDAATKHDFAKDPIRVQVDGDWVKADGTTLGADNGIGVSMGLALAVEAGVRHGPVEILLTVDEERGLTGAAGIEAGFFRSRRMINLDSEEDAAIFMGCAGGRDSILTLSLRAGKAPQSMVGRKLAIKGIKVGPKEIKGLRGGHSGLDINTGRGNANKLLARALDHVAGQMPLRVAQIGGGLLRNAIPREAEARVLVPAAKARVFKQLVDEFLERVKAEELQDADPDLNWQIGSSKVEKAWTESDTRRLLSLLVAIPSGVLGMSRALPDLVESSSNLGVVRTEGNEVVMVCCSRSSVMSHLDDLAGVHRALASLACAEIEQPAGYPGWQPNPASPLLHIVVDQYARLFGARPELKAVHAGLECGLLLRSYPDLDIVSFGPNIVGAHSPDERVQVSSVAKVWTLFKAVVEDLAR